MAKKKRRYFPDEVKRQAAERVETSGVSIVDVAAELGVHETQLRRWTRQFGQAGTSPARRPIRQAQGPSPADLAAENDEPWARLRHRRSDRRPSGLNRWRHGVGNSRTHGDVTAHSSIRIAAFETQLTTTAKPLPPRK